MHRRFFAASQEKLLVAEGEPVANVAHCLQVYGTSVESKIAELATQLFDSLRSNYVKLMEIREADRKFLDARIRSLVSFNEQQGREYGSDDYLSVIGLRDASDRVVVGLASTTSDVQPRIIRRAHFRQPLPDSFPNAINTSLLMGRFNFSSTSTALPDLSVPSGLFKSLPPLSDETTRTRNKCEFEPIPLHILWLASALHHGNEITFQVLDLETDEEAVYLKHLLDTATTLCPKWTPRVFLGFNHARLVFRAGEALDALFPYAAGCVLPPKITAHRLFVEDPLYCAGESTAALWIAHETNVRKGIVIGPSQEQAPLKTDSIALRSRIAVPIPACPLAQIDVRARGGELIRLISTLLRGGTVSLNVMEALRWELALHVKHGRVSLEDILWISNEEITSFESAERREVDYDPGNDRWNPVIRHIFQRCIIAAPLPETLLEVAIPFLVFSSVAESQDPMEAAGKIDSMFSAWATL